MTLKNNFRHNLLILRDKFNMSREDVAQKTDVSRNTIRSWEIGDSSPDVETLIKLSELFGVSLNHFVSSENILADRESQGKDLERIESKVDVGFAELAELKKYLIDLEERSKKLKK